MRRLPIGAAGRGLWLAIGLVLAAGLVLGGCWTGSPPPSLSLSSSGAAEPPARVLRVPRARSRGVLGKRPPRLAPAERRFPPELRAVRADAYGCAQRHKVSLTHTLFLEVSIDTGGAVTAARAAGFGAAEPCVLHALRARRFVAYTNTTISLTIPWSSAHPAP